MEGEGKRPEEVSGYTVTPWMIAGGVVIAGLTYFVYKRLFRRSSRNKVFPPETIVVHKYGAAATAPFLSPFTGKLETYLRLAKIPYEKINNHKQKSSKGKLPWIMHEGREVTDSQFIMEYCNKKYNVCLNAALSEQDLAVARAMWKMNEESIYWFMVVERWQYQTNPKWITDMGIRLPGFILKIAKYRVGKMTYAQGMGRHTREEQAQIVKADLRALSAQLGDKPFLFGDNPVEADCSVFGTLACIYFSLYGGVAATYIKEHPNLVAYILRIKDLVWPDWDQCLHPPKK